MRDHEILRHTKALFVHKTKVMFCVSIALFSGQPIPANRLRVILRDTKALAVHETKVVLCDSIALFSGQPVPANRFHVILRHTEALAVHEAKTNLRSGITLFGQGPPFLQRGGIVASRIGFKTRAYILRFSRRGDQEQRKQRGAK